MFLVNPTKRNVHQVKIWAYGRPEDWSTPQNPDVQKRIIQGIRHRLAKMRRRSVLHENDQIPSFFLQVLNLRGKIIVKHILVIASSNGAFHKKEKGLKHGHGAAHIKHSLSQNYEHEFHFVTLIPKFGNYAG
jgi:hypothetical protein